jgi:hypothetical protein
MSKRMRMVHVVLIIALISVASWVTLVAGAKKSSPLPAPVPQTGQINVQAEGDDGDVQAGVAWPVPRFTDLGKGSVRDNLTGLIWLKHANCFPGNGLGLTWQDAIDAANALASPSCGLADSSVEGDWRLPNVNELQSLIDWGNFNPALPDGHPFTGVQSAYLVYWSSTPVAITTHPEFAWFVPLDNGGAGGTSRVSGTASVWPVRGGSLAVDATVVKPKVKPVAPVPQTGQWQCWDAADLLIDCADTGQDGDFKAGIAWPIPRFTNLDNGTVRDNLTGLIWLRNANCFPGSGIGLLWEEALNAANHLAAPQCGLADGSVAGDWRLPNVNELRSLIDWGNFNLALPDGHPFTSVQSTYGSSTSLEASPSRAWYVQLSPGNAVPSDKGNIFAWPVRGGN